MRVRVVQLGVGVKVVDSDDDALTVREVLASQGIPAAGMDIRIGGATVGLEAAVRNGDLVTVVPRVKGGALRPR